MIQLSYIFQIIYDQSQTFQIKFGMKKHLTRRSFEKPLLKVTVDDFLFKGTLQYFSISSETTLDRNSNSFASFSWGFRLVLPPYFVCVRQPEVTGKPEVNRKTVRTARWCDIFIFSNMPYPDEKRWYHTQNDAFNLILKSNFD